MKIQKSNKKEVFEQANLQEDDVILYMGGRIDDDKLYPPEYSQYLNSKIEKLSPTKIICHNHWYAKKYYKNGILNENTKIDMIFVYYHYLLTGKLQMINPKQYSDHREWIKILIDKNPNIVYSMYISEGNKPPSVEIDRQWFKDDYNLDNVKYLTFDRKYSPSSLIDVDIGRGQHSRNGSDGFSVVTSLIKSGFKNINILGFSAFGSNEDMSYHSTYDCNGDPRFFGKKLFDINTSEDLRAESDILKHWVQTKRLNNLEDYDKLLFCLEEK